MFSVYIRVASETNSQEDLDHSLGANDKKVTKLRSVHSGASWERRLVNNSTTWPNLDGYFAGGALDGLADRIRDLVVSGSAKAWLEIVQEIDDTEDAQQRGIWLEPIVVEWANRAGAGIDIDQYFYDEKG